MKTTKFQLGQIVATPGALDAFEKAGQTPTEFLKRHVLGDWGDLCDEDNRTDKDAAVASSPLTISVMRQRSWHTKV